MFNNNLSNNIKDYKNYKQILKSLLLDIRYTSISVSGIDFCEFDYELDLYFDKYHIDETKPDNEMFPKDYIQPMKDLKNVVFFKGL